MSGEELLGSESEEDIKPNGHAHKKPRSSKIHASGEKVEISIDDNNDELPVVEKMTTTLERDVDGYVPFSVNPPYQ